MANLRKKVDKCHPNGGRASRRVAALSRITSKTGAMLLASDSLLDGRREASLALRTKHQTLCLTRRNRVVPAALPQLEPARASSSGQSE